MKISRDGNTIVVTQPALRFGAALLLVLGIGCFVGARAVLRETPDFVGFLFATLVAGVGIYLLRHSLLVVTEIAARFDGGARTLTIQRSRPWRKTSQSVGFGDIADIATRERGQLNVRRAMLRFYHGLEITLIGRHSVWMTANGRAECDEAARQLARLVWASATPNSDDSARTGPLPGPLDPANLLVRVAARWQIDHLER
jgi:hypothetical protein